MKSDARVQSAIEVIDDLFKFRQPVSQALKDWGKKNRFAGSKDRAAIASLVYDSLRVKGKSVAIMGKHSARFAVMGMLAFYQKKSKAELLELFSGSKHGPKLMNETEMALIENADVGALAPHDLGNVPLWIYEHFEKTFGESAVHELEGLATRAGLDVRVNALKGETRETILAKLPFKGELTPHSPDGLRYTHDGEGRGPSLESERLFQEGFLEIQDEGSQIAALLSGARPHELVIDMCAGAGGKTLALCALMQNEGQLIATDSDRRRLAPMFARMQRAGVQNVEVLAPVDKNDEPLEIFTNKADVVFVDAPCSGSGTWRRNPDAKWRMSANALQMRLEEQALVLKRAAQFVKVGGHLVYVTCSMLACENDDQIAAFLKKNKNFKSIAPKDALQEAGLEGMLDAFYVQTHGLQMTPAKTHTDGFYVAVLERDKI